MITSVSYTGTGAQTQFDLTFPYTNAASVLVEVNRVNTAFTWINSTRISISPAPANGAVVTIFRDTEIDDPARTYADNQVLSGGDLNASAGQLLNKVQELETEFDALDVRSLQAPPGESLPLLPAAASRANKFLGFDGAGNPLMSVSLGSGAEASAIAAAASAATAAGHAVSTAADLSATQSLYDQFDDRYLGAKSSDPTVDNDGNALVAGTLYFNTAASEMRVRTSGGTWVAGYIAAGGFVAKTGDTMTGKLNTLASAAGTAGLNTGVGSAAPSAPVNGDLWTLSTGLYVRINGITLQMAPLDSPAFSGVPTAPTPAAGTRGTQVATAAFAKTPAIQTVASAATVTPTFANDQVNITAQAEGLTLANPTGTAEDAWGIVVRVKDNGTARTIAYGSQYRAIGVTLPTTTVLNKTLYLGMVYNSTDAKWDVVSVAQQA